LRNDGAAMALSLVTTELRSPMFRYCLAATAFRPSLAEPQKTEALRQARSAFFQQ
jgi:hypothetical protein